MGGVECVAAGVVCAANTVWTAVQPIVVPALTGAATAVCREVRSWLTKPPVKKTLTKAPPKIQECALAKQGQSQLQQTIRSYPQSVQRESDDILEKLEQMSQPSSAAGVSLLATPRQRTTAELLGDLFCRKICPSCSSFGMDKWQHTFVDSRGRVTCTKCFHDYGGCDGDSRGFDAEGVSLLATPRTRTTGELLGDLYCPSCFAFGINKRKVSFVNSRMRVTCSECGHDYAGCDGDRRGFDHLTLFKDYGDLFKD